MRKIFILLSLLILSLTSTQAKIAKKWYHDSRLEIVNEQTVIFRSVVKVEIKTSDRTQITYVYDLKKGKLVRVERGGFECNLPVSDYLIQSNKRITKANYEILVE